MQQFSVILAKLGLEYLHFTNFEIVTSTCNRVEIYDITSRVPMTAFITSAVEHRVSDLTRMNK